MNKKLLYFLLPLGLVAGQVYAQQRAAIEICTPTNEWQAYACISRVEMNGMINETDPGIPGETLFGEDFRGDESKFVHVNPGQTYDLKIQFSNFNSGAADIYYLRAFFDWNKDYTYSKDETYTLEVPAGKKGGFVNKTMKVAVPADAVLGALDMRVFTNFQSDDPEYQGMEPCDLVESGQYEDYKIVVESPSGIEKAQIIDFSISPNPVRDELQINCDAPILSYHLFTVDGKLVRSGEVINGRINVSGNQQGMYILRVLTSEGIKVSNVIVE